MRVILKKISNKYNFYHDNTGQVILEIILYRITALNNRVKIQFKVQTNQYKKEI